MTTKLFLFSFLIVLILSCNSEGDRAIQERNALQQQLDDIKFGAPNLLSDAKQFIQAHDYSQARTKLSELLSRHSDRPEAAEGRSLLNNLDEAEAWDNAAKSDEQYVTYNYLAKYPNGKFVSNANDRLQKLKLQNEGRAYQNAKQSNSSQIWKQFLNDYPKHSESKSIKRKIIQLEVDEIFGDRTTGRLPSFEKVGGGYSSTSSISIRNDTGCELTVRYSGDDVRIIDIPAGGTRSINLSSGSYRIAASACGANYAGTESLQGDYTSSYYISRSRY